MLYFLKGLLVYVVLILTLPVTILCAVYYTIKSYGGDKKADKKLVTLFDIDKKVQKLLGIK